MTLLDKLYLPYTLKKVNRAGSNGERNESTAEHTYSTLFLAEYFLKFHPKLNGEKVRKIILYHDTFVSTESEREEQEKKEDKAYKKLIKTLPKELIKDYKIAWKEYLTLSTPEGRFAKAMDALDPLIHESRELKDWEKFNFTESKLRKYKEPHLKEFPILLKFFNETVIELKKGEVLQK
jgi:putative hydrolase of HD superfamily